MTRLAIILPVANQIDPVTAAVETVLEFDLALGVVLLLSFATTGNRKSLKSLILILGRVLSCVLIEL